MARKTSSPNFVPTEKAGKSAAIYIRVSQHEFKQAATDGSEDGATPVKQLRQSVKTQKDDGIKICKDKGWKYKIYDKDCEYSGALPPGKEARPDLHRLMTDVKRGIIHTIIFRDISRFARSLYHFTTMLEETIRPAGVVIHCTTFPMDLTTPMGQLIMNLMAALAQWELDHFKAITMHNRYAAAKEGKLLLNPYTYGYDNNGGKGPLVVVEEEAKVVKRVFNMILDPRHSYKGIADILNAENIPTKYSHKKGKNKRKVGWTGGLINKMVRNRRYIGEITYNGEVLPSPFHVIIDDALWAKVQAEVEKRSSKTPSPWQTRSRNLLNGILQCGYCLQTIKDNGHAGSAKDRILPNMIVTGTKSSKGGKRTPKRYYACQTRSLVAKGLCPGARAPKEKIEEFVERFIGAFTAEEFKRTASNQPDTVKTLESEIADTQKSLDIAQDKKKRLASKMAGEDDYDVELFEEAATKLSRRISELSRRIAELKQELAQVNQAHVEEAFDKLKEWKSLDLQSRRTALQKVVPRMIMYEDRLEIYIANLGNRPVVVDYVPRIKRRKTRDFPHLADFWPVFVAEESGRKLRYGAKLKDVETIRAGKRYKGAKTGKKKHTS